MLSLTGQTFSPLWVLGLFSVKQDYNTLPHEVLKDYMSWTRQNVQGSFKFLPINGY